MTVATKRKPTKKAPPVEAPLLDPNEAPPLSLFDVPVLPAIAEPPPVPPHAPPAPAAPADDGGVRCPKCGCPHCPVDYTRQKPKKIMRKRSCRNCGRSFITYETLPGA